jgi:hypothetical protein
MRMLERSGGVGAALLALATAAATAQTTGLPLRNSGIRTGIELGAELGLARIDGGTAAEDETSRTLAGSLSGGIGPLGARVTVARADRSIAGADRTSVTGSAGIRVFGGPLVPLSVNWLASVTVPVGEVHAVPGGSPVLERPWRGSLGLGAALSIPFPIVAITPWIGPRVEYYGRQTADGGRVKGAVAAGIELGFLNGLVLRASYDSRVSWEPAADAPAGVSFGVGYRFR